MKRSITSSAEIVREYGPFAGVDNVRGVTYDGQNVWFAAGDKLQAFDPESGQTLRSIDVAAHAAGRPSTRAALVSRLRRIAFRRSMRGRGVCWARSRRPAAVVTQGSRGRRGRCGWGIRGAGRSIRWIPRRGRYFARSNPSASSAGVTWVEGELWHATWEGDESDVRRVDPGTGEVLERLEMPAGVMVSGLESDGGDRFFCGGGKSGKVRVVRRPKRGVGVVLRWFLQYS